MEDKKIEDLDSILEQLTQKTKGGVRYAYNRYTEDIEEVYLSPAKRIALAVRGETALNQRVYAPKISGEYMPWSAPIQFYVYKSKENGRDVLLLDYRHSHAQRLYFGIEHSKDTKPLLLKVVN